MPEAVDKAGWREATRPSSSTTAKPSRRSASASRRSSASWSQTSPPTWWSSSAAAAATLRSCCWSVCPRLGCGRSTARHGCWRPRAQACAAYVDRLDLQAFDLAASDWRALRPARRCDLLLARGPSPRRRPEAAAVPGSPRGAARRRHLRARRSGPAREPGRLADRRRRLGSRGRHAFAGDLRLTTGRGASSRRRRWNYFRWPDDNGIDHPSTVVEHVLGWPRPASRRSICTGCWPVTPSCPRANLTPTKPDPVKLLLRNHDPGDSPAKPPRPPARAASGRSTPWSPISR